MSAQAPRVPAWKRLGLKLKGSAPPESPASDAHASQQPTTTPSKRINSARTNLGAASANKRKYLPALDQDTDAENKRQRREVDDGNAPSLKRQKSVSFAVGTKTDDAEDTIGTTTKPKRPRKKKKKRKQSKTGADDASSKRKATKSAAPEPDPAFDFSPALTYLRQWSTDRAAWKFNKNHQTLLTKYVFAADRAIPGTYLPYFLDYIHALKGSVRARLRDAALAAKAQADTMQGLDPASAPPVAKNEANGGDAQASKKQDQEAQQQAYDEVIAQFLDEVKQSRKHAELPSATQTTGKRSFDEVDFVLRTTANADVVVRQRVIKRIRAELVLDALSDSEESTTGTTSSSALAEDTGEMMDIDHDKSEAAPTLQEPVVDGSSQASQQEQPPKPKRVRRRKIRTAVMPPPQRDSSSDSDSEEDSSSDSSSSSEDSDDDDEELRAPAVGDDAETSSSSSSSEPVEEESESDEEESGEDDDGGSGEQA